MSALDINPDAAILSAFDKVRAFRSYAYSFDDLREGHEPDEKTQAEIAAQDAEMAVHESTIQSAGASTIVAVLARLQLVIPAIDQERWVDDTIMRHGLLALAGRAVELNCDAQQVTLAAMDLLRLDWQQALDAYERSSANFKTILEAKALAENEMFARRRSRDPSEFAEAVARLIEEISETVMDEDCSNIDRLIATPVPDWSAYRRKAEIAIKEAVADRAGPFLLRDANALLASQGGV